MDQSSNHHTRTEGWIMHQHELDRSGTSYEDQPHQRDPRSFITPAQDPAHAYLPVSQYNAQLLQVPERKPTLQLLPTIQESPQFSPQQQPPISNHLPPSSSQVGHNFREYVAQPTVIGQVGQGVRQNITQPTFIGQVGQGIRQNITQPTVTGQVGQEVRQNIA